MTIEDKILTPLVSQDDEGGGETPAKEEGEGEEKEKEEGGEGEEKKEEE